MLAGLVLASARAREHRPQVHRGGDPLLKIVDLAWTSSTLVQVSRLANVVTLSPTSADVARRQSHAFIYLSSAQPVLRLTRGPSRFHRCPNAEITFFAASAAVA
jgi:hypothetical protein